MNTVGKGREVKARQGKARQGKARQGKGREGKGWEGKGSQLAVCRAKGVYIIEGDGMVGKIY